MKKKSLLIVVRWAFTLSIKSTDTIFTNYVFATMNREIQLARNSLRSATENILDVGWKRKFKNWRKTTDAVAEAEQIDGNTSFT